MVCPSLHYVWTKRKTVFLLTTPLLLLPLPLTVKTTEASCAYVMLLMATFWITEAIPIAVTSLIPLVLFPALGVLPAKAVGSMYFKDATWLVIGSLMIAIGFENTGLHRRIALRVLIVFGVKPKMLMLGFMSVTCFLSLWIGNLPVTAMMIPVAEAVIRELFGKEAGEADGECGSLQEEELEPLSSKARQIKKSIIKGITICVPYSASIGGIASLTGTAPNVMLVGMYEELFPNSTQKLSYVIWMVYCLPQALVFLLLAYIWLSCWFIGYSLNDVMSCCKKSMPKTNAERNAEKALRREYAKLGDFTWGEGTVVVVLVTTILMWFLRDPGFMPGISDIFLKGYISDATVAVTMGLSLFVLPQRKPWSSLGKQLDAAIIDWPAAQRMFPWDVPIVIGGGFALAGGTTQSGLADLFNKQLVLLGGMENWLICFIAAVLVCLMTEVVSNMATTNLIVPILAVVAKTLEIHPLHLLMPCILAASFAFMLPVATPVNVLAFSYNRISVADMVKAGTLMNILGILVTTIFIFISLFGLHEFPSWANGSTPGVTKDGAMMAAAFVPNVTSLNGF